MNVLILISVFLVKQMYFHILLLSLFNYVSTPNKTAKYYWCCFVFPLLFSLLVGIFFPSCVLFWNHHDDVTISCTDLTGTGDFLKIDTLPINKKSFLVSILMAF